MSAKYITKEECLSGQGSRLLKHTNSLKSFQKRVDSKMNGRLEKNTADCSGQRSEGSQCDAGLACLGCIHCASGRELVTLIFQDTEEWRKGSLPDSHPMVLPGNIVRPRPPGMPFPDGRGGASLPRPHRLHLRATSILLTALCLKIHSKNRVQGKESRTGHPKIRREAQGTPLQNTLLWYVDH